jgi:para-aminobenzoate synthetase component 1
MLKINEQKFLEMDELSLQKVPFFFVIDFLMENVLIFSQEDLEAQKILVDFPNFKNVQPFMFETKEVTWKSFPQSKEELQKKKKF